MRVSERMRYGTVQNRVEASKDLNAKALETLSSQKRITKLSDDPIGAKDIINGRNVIRNKAQFMRNIDFSKGYLERTEQAISGLTSAMIRAKELAISMSNDTNDQNARNASAREVQEVIDEVFQLGNATFNGRYVFAGFRNQTPPLNANGDYLGDDGKIFIQVDKGNFRQMNIQARGLFEASVEEMGQGHMGMVQTFDVLLEGLKKNDKTMIRKSMQELEHHLEKTTSYQATIGGIHNSLSGTSQRLETEKDFERANLSKVQDADMFEATSEFKRTETVLQSTLMASNKLLQPSLLNFMQ
jgi:flagellar hook-associated protein 3 FlgL